MLFMKQNNIFNIISIIFIGIFIILIEMCLPTNKSHENFVPDITNTYLEFFIIVPLFLIVSFTINTINLKIKLKIFVFILLYLFFIFFYMLYLPNRNLRLFE